MLPPDAQARHLASQFVQPQGDGNPLLASHPTVEFELELLCGLGPHLIYWRSTHATRRSPAMPRCQNWMPS